MIGPVTIVSESSIGAGHPAHRGGDGRGGARSVWVSAGAQSTRRRGCCGSNPSGVLDALQKVLDRQRQADKELQRLRGERLQQDAARLAQLAQDGVVVRRQDGFSPEQLRDLAQAVRRRGQVVVLAGSPDGSKVAVAVAGDGAVDAGATAKSWRTGGGRRGGSPELAVAGGRDVSGIDNLLAEARRRLGA